MKGKPFYNLLLLGTLMLLLAAGCTKRRPDLKDVTAWAPTSVNAQVLPTPAVPTPVPTVGTKNVAQPATPTPVPPPPPAPTLPVQFPSPTPLVTGETHIYIVQTGDTLSSIALKAGTSVEVIKQLNGLFNDNIIAGQKLRLPGKALVSTATPTKYQEYTVQTGDTLTTLAAQFGTTVDEIMRLNQLTDPNSLYVGQKLLLPPLPPATYVVKEGDTLSSIAAKFGVTPQAIIAANHIANPNMLHVGQKLFIPGQ